MNSNVITSTSAFGHLYGVHFPEAHCDVALNALGTYEEWQTGRPTEISPAIAWQERGNMMYASAGEAREEVAPK